ncbi:unnamed protein product [Calicophoron daubneyi]|uniref:BEN domain-containing protein n=1 Tax=Calicophoron daubneyi TaxID=300641 RepID=A0AAV2TL02_CALDB
MSHVVVEFDDDGKVCVVPESWVKGDNVFLPPMSGRNLRIAIMQALPPNETWDEYPATCVLPARPYDIAAAFAKKFASKNDDSDTSPCRGVERKRRPRSIRRYTPDPTDEETPDRHLPIPPPNLHSTIISPASGPSSAPSLTYPVMRPTSFCGGVDAGLNLSTTENAAPGQPNTGCESILQAIYSLDKKMTNYCSDIVSRLENLELHVTALDTHVNNYHCDTLRSTGNQEPKPPRWQPWFPLRTIAELQAMEINLQNENCRADVATFVQITPSSNIEERTKCGLSRMVSNDLARHLSWQKTPNRLPFGNTALWAVILETLTSSSGDPEASNVAIRRTCIAWFQNARDRNGGRVKRKYTFPKMPLLEKNNENMPVEEEGANMSTSVPQS